MIKSLVVSTKEIDDIEFAVEDITSQLAAFPLCANSVGIITCHCEFLGSGAMKAICDSLPFDVAGTVTGSQANNTGSGVFLLSIMILTSDDVSFNLNVTPSLADDSHRVTEDFAAEIFSENPDKLALAFTYMPFIVPFLVDEFVDIISRGLNGTPCFGVLALDESETFENSYVCVNGEAYRDRAAVISFYGDVNPKFLCATISPEKIINKPALITKCSGNILMEINGHSVEQYFEDLGLESVREMKYAMASVPFLLDYGDGTPLVSKIFMDQTPEKYAVCAGIIKECAAMYVGMFDKEDVLLTTGQAIDKALEIVKAENLSGILMYSCTTRCVSLGGDSMSELELIKNKIGDKVPFMVSYSGGEICPVMNNNSEMINRCHNNTFILCIF